MDLRWLFSPEVFPVLVRIGAVNVKSHLMFYLRVVCCWSFIRLWFYVNYVEYGEYIYSICTFTLNPLFSCFRPFSHFFVPVCLQLVCLSNRIIRSLE